MAQRQGREGDLVKSAVLVVVKTVEEAETWVTAAVKLIGLGFHPDTPARDYDVVRESKSEPLFAVAECPVFDRARKASFRLLGDKVYEIGAALMFPLVDAAAAKVRR